MLVRRLDRRRTSAQCLPEMLTGTSASDHDWRIAQMAQGHTARRIGGRDTLMRPRQHLQVIVTEGGPLLTTSLMVVNSDMAAVEESTIGYIAILTSLKDRRTETRQSSELVGRTVVMRSSYLSLLCIAVCLSVCLSVSQFCCVVLRQLSRS